MNTALKVISLLLSYPSEDIRVAIPELKAALDGAGIGERETEALMRLADDIASLDLYDAQERYVLLFDRTRSLSLHLFEHVHGESRDRGQAMIDLKSLYKQNGLCFSTSELPDYLPAFLEFLSTRPLAEARQLLGQPAHILAALAERLEKRDASYAAVFRALEALAVPATDTQQMEVVPEDADPNDFAALDAQWEEEAVTFGSAAAPSCKDRLVAQIRAGRRPVSDVPLKGEAP